MQANIQDLRRLREQIDAARTEATRLGNSALHTIVLGIVNAFVRGYNLFDLVSLPQIGDRALRRPITQWHGLAANVLLGLALFHAAAALVHVISLP